MWWRKYNPAVDDPTFNDTQTHHVPAPAPAPVPEPVPTQVPAPASQTMSDRFSSAEFAQEYVSPNTILPLSTGPTVNIRIGDASYDVHKEMLCKNSPYFDAMFNGRFAEGTNQSVKLEEMTGVVSPRGFEALLQWIYCGYVKLDESGWDRGKRISTLLELLRFADMAGIAVDEAQLTAQIRAAMVEEPLKPDLYCAYRGIDHVSEQHVQSASRLRAGHPVRVLFAQAATAEYLTSPEFKFAKELHEIPEFGTDVLQELTPVLGKVNRRNVCRGPCVVEFVDPFTQRAMGFDGKFRTSSDGRPKEIFQFLPTNIAARRGFLPD